MDDSGAKICIKVMIIVTCIFYILGGLVYLGGGIGFVSKYSDEDVEVDAKVGKPIGIAAIISGCIMILVGIVGCVASSMNNKPLLLIFASLMIVDAVIMLGLGITTIVFSTKTNHQKRFQSEESTKEASSLMLTMGIILLVLAIYNVALGIMVIYLAKNVRPRTQYYPYYYNERQPTYY